MTAATPLWFLREDLEDLQRTIEDVKDQIRKTKLEAQEGTEQSSESWHDNYVFEESQRQLKMLLSQLGSLSKTLERAELRDQTATADEVAFGTVVTIETDGTTDQYAIGSAMVFDRMRDKGYISYQAPVAAALLGARKGESRQVNVGGNTKTLHVRDIQPAHRGA